MFVPTRCVSNGCATRQLNVRIDNQNRNVVFTSRIVNRRIILIRTVLRPLLTTNKLQENLNKKISSNFRIVYDLIFSREKNLIKGQIL